MGREEDIRFLEEMFGVGCCDCLDRGRPRLSPHPLDRLRVLQEPGTRRTEYIEMNLRTGDITYHPDKK